ncbi:tryptophan synthase beta subunit-like PLP-dependent enzyme [Suillus bovinus]|uniref:tryptophan synthase beta subunit-like PLP-dependent enzyme n=1 Tax=Suillus bovinus TaxID=48563 RepID=UPI001B870CC6|nr:tryptophan synthase beta subunit-like PLP-dependent enzyme [Suillus bovinus]KAG2142314.1 tryptophan synthase beta subunit-like PLP-dependent enzyme [Suillus bovinus]
MDETAWTRYRVCYDATIKKQKADAIQGNADDPDDTTAAHPVAAGSPAGIRSESHTAGFKFANATYNDSAWCHPDISAPPATHHQQDIVKALFADTIFNAKPPPRRRQQHKLGPQPHPNTLLLPLLLCHPSHPLTDAELQFIVPTCNFGDILAGYYVKRVSLPMAKLVVATNANDILTRVWKTGRYEKVDSNSSSPVVRGVVETLLPAMDILVWGNFERFKLVMPARKDFTAEGADDEQIRRTVREYHTSAQSYNKDPHIAVGLHISWNGLR